MNHKTSVCEASNATASSGWATFSPDTEAMTAMSAMQTPTKIVRRCRGSWMVGPASEDRFVRMGIPFKKARGIGAGRMV
ncbi:hypothetical protein GCM10009555_095540 [Acrocarpospora macrocephala]|uniref:Uncharacterized protein n=1 Tax=Acrocarpospora macrocephala TaxID=150177 RepID=A0A5M3WQE3_9ACTN|nr:hypothetical protein Amac_030970 [Acrocarpospora macrocephala]